LTKQPCSASKLRVPALHRRPVSAFWLLCVLVSPRG
jgi:hypothetical protein